MEKQNVLSMVSRAFREVFRDYRYIVLAGFFSFLIFAISVWLRNLQLLGEVVASSLFSFPEKILLFVRFLGGITTSVSALTAFLIVLTALLFGINIAFFIYFLRKNKRLAGGRAGTVAASGLVSGIFGVGCASCGAFLLTALLSSVGASGLITFFPLQGAEFNILSIILLSVSIVLLTRAMYTSKVCKDGVCQVIPVE